MNFEAEVYIIPRKEILDLQGKAVKKALFRLGYADLQEVAIGKVIKIKLKAENEELAKESVKSMCEDLLVNELIEEYNIKIEALC